MFVCQQAGSISRWTVNLPGGSSNEISNPATSSQAGRVLSFSNDPGFGFEIHILNSSSASSVITELRVTAVRQLNGVTVECAGDRFYTSTIQIASVGKLVYMCSCNTNYNDNQYLTTIKIPQLLQVD